MCRFLANIPLAEMETGRMVLLLEGLPVDH